MLDRIRNYRRKRYVDRLVRNGLTLGAGVYLNDGFFLDPAHCFLITIEDGVTFGPGVKVFAHDASSLKPIGKTKIGLVRLGKNCFVGAGAIILPSSSIGAESILGAQSLLSGHIPEGQVWGGNPARFIMTLNDYKIRLNALPELDFTEAEYAMHRLTPERKRRMIQALGNHRFGFMKP